MKKGLLNLGLFLVLSMTAIQEGKADSDAYLGILLKADNIKDAHVVIDYENENSKQKISRKYSLVKVEDSGYLGISIKGPWNENGIKFETIKLFAAPLVVVGKCAQATGIFTVPSDKQPPFQTEIFTFELGKGCDFIVTSYEIKGKLADIEKSLPVVDEGR